MKARKNRVNLCVLSIVFLDTALRSTRLENIVLPFTMNSPVQRSSIIKDEFRSMLIIKAKLILVVKEPGEKDERTKVCIAAQATGSRDRDKKMLMMCSPSVNRTSTRLMLAFATGLRLDLYSRDTSQPYVTTNSRLIREVYLILQRKVGIDPDRLCKFERLLYGLPKSGVHWFETYFTHHQDKLKIKSSEADPCLLYRKNGKGRLDAIEFLQVDDSIGAGTHGFLSQEEKQARIFNYTDQFRLSE